MIIYNNTETLMYDGARKICNMNCFYELKFLLVNIYDKATDSVKLKRDNSIYILCLQEIFLFGVVFSWVANYQFKQARQKIN